MANNRARAYLMQKGVKDRQDLRQQWEDLQAENKEKMDKAGWGRLLGMGAGLLIPGLPLWGSMLAAGLGSWAGSEAGETGFFSGSGVKGAEGIKGVGTQAGMRSNLQDVAETSYGGFGQQQVMDAVGDAGKTFALGGGHIGKGADPLMDQLKAESTLGLDNLLGLDAGVSLFDHFNPIKKIQDLTGRKLNLGYIDDNLLEIGNLIRGSSAGGWSDEPGGDL